MQDKKHGCKAKEIQSDLQGGVMVEKQICTEWTGMHYIRKVITFCPI